MQSSIIASSPFRSFSSVLYIAHLRPSFSDCFCLSFPQFLEDMLGTTHRPRGLVDGGAACLSVCLYLSLSVSLCLPLLSPPPPLCLPPPSTEPRYCTGPGLLGRSFSLSREREPPSCLTEFYVRGQATTGSSHLTVGQL